MPESNKVGSAIRNESKERRLSKEKKELITIVNMLNERKGDGEIKKKKLTKIATCKVNGLQIV